MNTVEAFLTKHWQRLPLDTFSTPPRLSSVVITPRFRASAHVLFFVLAAGKTEPLLVVKVPRLPGDHSRLDREAANLRQVQAARSGGFESIPRVVAYEDYGDSRLLIETALDGQTMDPTLVRRQPQACISAGLTWLIDLHQATISHPADAGQRLQDLVEDDLAHFEGVFPLCAEEKHLIEQTHMMLAPLYTAVVPLVFEHGDFSAPNILKPARGGLAVVDWELAEPQGIPAVDLFFFLAYTAFAQQRARKLKDYLAAFRQAFFGTTAWTRPYIAQYAHSLHLPPEVLKPLFVLCWSRYMINLVMRLNDLPAHQGQVDHATATWLRSNRYYALWRYTLEHVGDLNIGAGDM